MIKKKLNILLLLSLALLFISLLGTTSLAFEPTKNELKNFFYNYALYYYSNTQDAETNATNLVNNLDDSKLDEWLGYISRYQGKYVLSANNGKIYYWCYTGTEANLNNHKPFYVNGYDTSQIFVNSSYISSWIWTYQLSNNTFYNYQNSSSINITLLTNTNASSRTLWFYTDTNIWNSAYNSIVWNSGYMTPSNLFNGPNSDDTFIYARSELDTEIIDLDNTYYFNNQAEAVLFAYNPFSGDEINEADGVIVGYLWDADKFDKAIFSRYNFNPTTRLFEYSGVTWESKNIGNIHDNMIWVELHARDYGNALKPDSIIHVEFVPNTTEFNNIHVDYYIRSPYSNIVDGKLNVGGTFSGDYSLMINNNNNTDKIIDNTNDDSNVENIITEELSGDYSTIANKIGYSPLENPFLSIIRYVLEGICNTLLGSGNVTLPLEIRGTTYILHSEDFSTPSGLLATFISGLLVTFYLYAFYRFGFGIYEKLQSGDFQSVINNLSSNNNNNDWRTM